MYGTSFTVVHRKQFNFIPVDNYLTTCGLSTFKRMTSNALWVQNFYSLANGSSSEVTYQINYISSFVALAILAHSYYLHRRKYDSVRICTDLGCLSTAFSGLCLYLSTRQTNATTSAAIFVTVYYVALGPLIVQLCDCYFFYSRLWIVRGSLPLWERIIIHSYIWIVLVGTWLPTDTVVPTFYDTNSDDYMAIYFILNSIYSVGSLLYNFYFTGQCLWIFFKLTRHVVAIRREEKRKREERLRKRRNRQKEGSRKSNQSSRPSATHSSGGDSDEQSVPFILRLAERIMAGADAAWSSSLFALLSPFERTGRNSGAAVEPITTGEGLSREQQQQQHRQSKVAEGQPPVELRPPAIVPTNVVSQGKIDREQERGGDSLDYENEGDDDNVEQDGGTHNLHNMIAGFRKIKIVAIKSIGHAITSSFAALYYSYGGEVGSEVWGLFIIVGMHFWFNTSIETDLGIMRMSCKHSIARLCRSCSFGTLSRSNGVIVVPFPDTRDGNRPVSGSANASPVRTGLPWGNRRPQIVRPDPQHAISGRDLFNSSMG